MLDNLKPHSFFNKDLNNNNKKIRLWLRSEEDVNISSGWQISDCLLKHHGLQTFFSEFASVTLGKGSVMD